MYSIMYCLEVITWKKIGHNYLASFDVILFLLAVHSLAECQILYVLFNASFSFALFYGNTMPWYLMQFSHSLNKAFLQIIFISKDEYFKKYCLSNFTFKVWIVIHLSNFFFVFLFRPYFEMKAKFNQTMEVRIHLYLRLKNFNYFLFTN